MLAFRPSCGPWGTPEIRDFEQPDCNSRLAQSAPPFRQGKHLAECQKGARSSVLAMEPRQMNWGGREVYLPRNTHILGKWQRLCLKAPILRSWNSDAICNGIGDIIQLASDQFPQSV